MHCGCGVSLHGVGSLPCPFSHLEASDACGAQIPFLLQKDVFVGHCELEALPLRGG